MSIEKGTELAHYKILEKIGAGGMGEVYLAHDTKLDRKIALKVLPPELAESEERRARFKREAKAIAALNHPNSVQVYSVEEADGVHFITMEHVTGKTLSAALPRHGFPIRQFLDLAISLTEAAAAAHENGITHRDLKPDNVIVTKEGGIKVLDFGLAKPSTGVGSAASDSDLPTEQMTKEGRILGTVAYMSPEQAEGKSVDARSDIFALGVNFYEMLTGTRSFQGETPASTLSAVLKDEPQSLTKLVPSLPRDIARIVKRCLAKDPSRRYQTTIDVRNELDELARALDSGETMADAAVSPRALASRRALPWIAFAGGGLLVALWMSDVVPTSLDNAGPVVPTFTNARQITSAIGVEHFPTWSPDGQTLAYESNRTGKIEIWVQQIEGGAPIIRTPDSDSSNSNPSWSPDGRNIAFVSSQETGRAYHVMSALGGEARRVMATANDTMLFGAPQWLSGGAELAGVAEDGTALEIFELATRQSRRLTLPVEAKGTVDWSWSPDGRLLAYVDAVSRPAQTSRIWMMRLDDDQAFPVTEDGNNWGPIWSRDGASLYFISNRGGAMDLWAREVDSERGPVGPAVPITVGIGMRSASFSSDGSKLAYSKGRTVMNVWRVPILRDRPATWADAEPVSSEQAYIEEMDVSPDGTELVLNSDRAGNLDLWVVPLDGGEWRALTTHPGGDWAPRYSADGKEVVFHSHRDGKRDLFIVPSEGGVARPLIQSPEFELQPTFSPDGKRVAYWNKNSQDIWVVSTKDGSRGPLIEVAGTSLMRMPEWSPDGNHIAYTIINAIGSTAGSIGYGTEVWKASSMGEDAVRIAAGDGWVPRWSADSSSIYFLRDQNIWMVSADGGDERPMTDLAGKRGLMGPISLTTDDRYLYFTWGGDTGDIWVMDVVTDASE